MKTLNELYESNKQQTYNQGQWGTILDKKCPFCGKLVKKGFNVVKNGKGQIYRISTVNFGDVMMKPDEKYHLVGHDCMKKYYDEIPSMNPITNTPVNN